MNRSRKSCLTSCWVREVFWHQGKKPYFGERTVMPLLCRLLLVVQRARWRSQSMASMLSIYLLEVAMRDFSVFLRMWKFPINMSVAGMTMPKASQMSSAFLSI